MQKRVLILCDKNPHTSFGRIAEAFHRATRGTMDASLVWLRCPKDFPNPEPMPDLQLWSPSRETGRFSFPFQLATLLKEQVPDWVILIRPELGFLVPTIRRAAPQAKQSLMIHDTFAETLYPGNLKFLLINRFWVRGCDQVDGFLLNSRYTLEEAKKVFHVHGPQSICGCVVDPRDFYPLREDALLLRRKWGLPMDQKLLLHISLDEPRKNIPAFLKLAKRMPECHFARIGKFSPWIQEFLNANQIGNLTHHSGLDLDSLREFYHMADALVFPSLLEGFGYPPLEALACGTPVIASNTSAMAEILPGMASLVNEPLDIEEWERSTRKVLSQGKVLPDLVQERLQAFGPEAFTQHIHNHAKQLGLLE